MGVLASDNFNRADGGLGANWTTLGTALSISGNHVVPSNTNSDCGGIYSAITWPNDQYGQVAVGGTAATGSDTGMGVVLRFADSSNYYRIVVSGDGTDNVAVGKRVSGVHTVITTITQAWTSGDVLKVSVEGTTLKVYRNGVQIGTDITGDAALSTGSVGIAYSSTAASSTADDFEGGDLTTGQILLASADSVDGTWTDQAGGTSLAAAIDETSFSDSDYIRSELGPANSACRVKLASGGDPASSSGHIIHWRAGKDTTGGATIGMTVKLYQGGGNSIGGGSLIASFTRSNVDAFTTYDETLSAGEADSITNYADLYLEFSANQT